MALEISSIIILCASFFFAGVMDAVSGGGGLLTLPTLMLVGFPVHFIAGTNQCSCLLGSVTALCRYVKSGKVHWLTAVISAATAIFGSVLGAKLNLVIPDRYLRAVMFVLLPFVAVLILVNKEFGRKNRIDTLSKRQQIFRAVAIGLILGAYTGFYGAGGGTFILLSFAVFTRLDLITVSGNTKICSAAATLTASLTYALSGAVVWRAVFFAMIFNIAGNYIGANLALQKGSRIIRPMFIVALGLLFLRLLGTVVF